MTSSEGQTRTSLSAVGAALAAVEAELCRHEQGTGRVSDPEQLRAVLRQLVEVRDQLLSGGLPAPENRLRGLGRAITDSWPLNNQTGAMVLAAEHAYLEATA
jgi:hypothetical protein